MALFFIQIRCICVMANRWRHDVSSEKGMCHICCTCYLHILGCWFKKQCQFFFLNLLFHKWQLETRSRYFYYYIFLYLWMFHYIQWWRLFLVCTNVSLKGVLLKSGNYSASVGTVHSVQLTEIHENMETVLEKLKYDENKLDLIFKN